MKTNNFEEVADYITANQKKFYLLAYSYAGNEQDALDIVQNAVCRALQGYHSIKNMNYLSTWFYKVLVNESLSFLKKRQREVPMPEDAAEDCAFYEKAFEPENEDLYDAVNRLPPDVQTVLKLRFYEEFSLKEIAEITNTNLNTVKARLYRGLKALNLEVKK